MQCKSVRAGEREAGERERSKGGTPPVPCAALYLLLELVDRARKGTAPHALLPPLVREHANNGAQDEGSHTAHGQGEPQRILLLTAG